jgi:hypothetical protein
VVRLWTLTPPFAGSNPATPVLKIYSKNLNQGQEKVVFNLHYLHNQT